MRITRHGRIGPLLRFLSVVVVSLTTGFFRRDWRHLERIPKHGPAILAVNHVSYADPFLAARLVWDAGRIPRFLGKAPLFEVPVIGAILSAAGQIPVRRATREAADSLDAAVAALRAGEIVVIYPEGTVTRDPDFWPIVAKTGVARLALVAPEVAVIPVGSWGTQNSVDWYRRKFRLLPRKAVTMSVGLPVDTSAYVDQPITPHTLRALTDAVMTDVRNEVADIRGLTAPEDFAPRPPARAPKSNGATLDRANADRADADRADADRAISDRADADRADADRANADRANSDRANSDRANSDGLKEGEDR